MEFGLEANCTDSGNDRAATARTYPRSTLYLTAFLRRHLPHMKEWGAQRCIEYTDWFCSYGLALCLTRNGRLDSAVLFRRVNNRQEAETDYTHMPNGEIAYIDIAVAKRPGGTRDLFTFFFNTAGHACRWLAFARHRYGNRVSLLKMADAHRLF